MAGVVGQAAGHREHRSGNMADLGPPREGAIGILLGYVDEVAVHGGRVWVLLCHPPDQADAWGC